MVRVRLNSYNVFQPGAWKSTLYRVPMRISVPPAPRMDGCDLSGFCAGQSDELEFRLANYFDHRGLRRSS